MTTYIVKSKMPDHSWFSSAGTFEASNEALGNVIQRVLEAEGYQVTKQDTKAETEQ